MGDFLPHSSSIGGRGGGKWEPTFAICLLSSLFRLEYPVGGSTEALIIQLDSRLVQNCLFLPACITPAPEPIWASSTYSDNVWLGRSQAMIFHIIFQPRTFEWKRLGSFCSALYVSDHLKPLLNSAHWSL